MHKIITNCFGFIKHIFYFLRLVCVFCILMLLIYWIQNLTKSNWEWISFIKPFLDWLLEEANKMYSISFNLWGAVFELKYLSALIILTAGSFVFKLLIFITNIFENLYRGTRMIYKKTEETLLNNKLEKEDQERELKIQKFSVCIKTRIKKKFSHSELNINLEGQNQLMKDFIKSKLEKEPMVFNKAFLYQFDNFQKIDSVLTVMFKLIKSSAPIEYAICIQTGDNFEQLNKLMDLEHYGKITIAADTAYRYKFNQGHRYQINQLGVFQYNGQTIEVKEFNEIL